MRNRRFFSLVLLAPLAVVVSGCGKSVTQRAAESLTENAIERSTNGAADVDVDSNTIRVNVNGVAWQAGEQVTKPAGFPADVYLIDGTLTTAITTVENEAYSVTVSVTQSVASVKAAYDRELQAAGWSITGTASVGGAETIVGEKGGRTVSVTIAQDTNDTAKTTVVLTTSTSNTNS